MTDGSETKPGPGAAPRWLSPAVDYTPLVLFFLAYVLFDLFVATAVVMAACTVAATVSWLVTRRLPFLPLMTAGVVAVFGGLTLWLRVETFIKMKPTIIQALFALILLGGLAFRRPLLKPLLGQLIPHIDDTGWLKLNFRCAIFFTLMAGLNEAVWRSQTTDIWVTFKVFGIPALTFVFLFTQWPLLTAASESGDSELADGK